MGFKFAHLLQDSEVLLRFFDEGRLDSSRTVLWQIAALGPLTFNKTVSF